MPLPSSPAADAFTGHLGMLADLERHGRDVLRRFSPAQLAAALYASVYVEQLDGRLAALDLDDLEDLCGRVQRIEHADGKERLA